MSPQVGMAPAERDAMLDGIFAALDQCDIDRLAETVITATGCDPRTEPDFGGITINAVKAPTYDRHFVVNGTALVKGGLQLGSIDSLDVLTLEHIDHLRTLLDEMAFPLQPVKIADDPAAADEPMYVLYVSPRQYSQLVGNGSSTGIRAFQQNAWNRASYGSKHPLFKGEVGMWNGILVKKLNRAIRFGTGSSTKVVLAADAATAAETTQAIAAGITVTDKEVDDALKAA